MNPEDLKPVDAESGLPEEMQKFPMPDWDDELRQWFWRRIETSQWAVIEFLTYKNSKLRPYLGERMHAISLAWPKVVLSAEDLRTAAWHMVLDGTPLGEPWASWSVANEMKEQSFEVKVVSLRRGIYELRSSKRFLRGIIREMSAAGLLPSKELKRFVLAG